MRGTWIYLLLAGSLLAAPSSGQLFMQKAVKNGYPMPKVVKHAQWEAFPPLGVDAEAVRRNLSAHESLKFKDLKLEILEMAAGDTTVQNKPDTVKLYLLKEARMEEKLVAEGEAFNWQGYHIAVLAIHTQPGELGAGLVELEIADAASIPEYISQSTTAGNASYRCRVPQTITTITLHHSGEAKPMTLQDNAVKKLKDLQTWGKNDKNWWDVPYHFLIAPDGTIYEGRDYRYMGETNTKYDPNGHLLITVMGNYEIQKPTPEQLKSIMDLMAWAVDSFNVPLDKIYGHKDLAQTDCPGQYLYQYLNDGTFQDGIKLRLGKE
jgi:hypothetical protein